MIVLAIGYIVISSLVGILFLLSTLAYKLFSNKVNMTYILSTASFLVVAILKIFYGNQFSIIGSLGDLNGVMVVFQIITAAIPAAILACLAHPEGRKNSLKVEVLTGMAVEIPSRALVQNLFVVFGATSVVFLSVTNSIVLTAIIWVQFIIVQEVMMKKSLGSKVVLDSVASVWFSVWVGVIYLTTGSIILAMITHGLERWVAFMIRKSKILEQGWKNFSLNRITR